MGPMTSEARLIRNRDREIWAKNAVIFNDHDDRIDNRNFLPNPVVVPIDVDTQKANLTPETGMAQKLIDIFASYKRLACGQSMAPINFILLDEPDGSFVFVQDQAAPVIIQQ